MTWVVHGFPSHEAVMSTEHPAPWMTFDDVSYRFVSYAQNQEDVFLWRLWKDRPGGFYVDVGANHPLFHSVTKQFSIQGWRGINVEPNPILHRALVEDRPRDINLNLGVSDSDSTLTFHEYPQLHGWSTFDESFADQYRQAGMTAFEREVPIRTLDSILAEHVPPGTAIDFLKVDVEGFEPRVFAGLDLRRWRPRVILVESNGRELWEPRVLGSGYAFAAFDGINRYYAQADDRVALDAMSTPVNVLDFFIPYEHYRLIQQLVEVRPGPHAIEALRKMKRFAHDHPHLARFARRILRRTG